MTTERIHLSKPNTSVWVQAVVCGQRQSSRGRSTNFGNVVSTSNREAVTCEKCLAKMEAAAK